MIYFIPAWYQKNSWRENEQAWHARRMRTEFDDTVKQIQLFHRSSDYPYQILLLGFTPNFRHFLHRQGVFHAPYWSCFDAMQEINRKKARVFSFHDLAWPEHIEFVYSAFAVVAMLRKKIYAQIEFGEDGNPIRIDIYENGRICRQNIYDDRGFVSCSVVYENGSPVYRDYLMENGIWKLRESIADGHVEINPKYPMYLLATGHMERSRRYEKLSYTSMDEVIQEVLTYYLRLTDGRDLFCIAMHKQHDGVLSEVLKYRKKLLSFFKNRYSFAERTTQYDFIAEAEYVITDSTETTEWLEKEYSKPIERITDISPYDTRVDFGISQQLNVQKLMVAVDGLSEEAFVSLIQTIGIYLMQNENAQVHLFTREAAYQRGNELIKKTENALEKAGFPTLWVRERAAENVAENQLEEAESVPVRFFVEQCVDELTVSRCMKEQRLLIDLRETPELFLQISAVSMGIPQIVRKKTQFLEHGKNGRILTELAQLPEILDYYLNGLANWNEAMVNSYEIGKRYTTGELLKQWKEVIEIVG